jgi:hypothetical protein
VTVEREKNEYTIPESLRWDGGPTSIALRSLSAGEEIQASKVGGLDFTKTQYDAVKRAICEADGKPVNYANGEVDKLWEQAGPKMRALFVKAFNKLTSPSEQEDGDFFASRSVKVG